MRTRRVLLLYKVYSDSALLVLNRTSLICNNVLLALNLRYLLLLNNFKSKVLSIEEWKIVPPLLYRDYLF